MNKLDPIAVGGVSNVLVKNIGACAESIEEKSTMLKQTSAEEFDVQNLHLANHLIDNCIKAKNSRPSCS